MADINVTPLVDVMLVLLIIFMITAPLLTTGVPIHLPDSRAAALDQKEQPIQISIDAAGTIYVDDDPVPEAGLAERLALLGRQRTRGGETPQVYLRADRGLDYGKVMTVMGELNLVGLNKLALVSVGKDAR
jgi:biopolymer transport protein TolR